MIYVDEDLSSYEGVGEGSHVRKVKEALEKIS
jgi:hypothetical protein